MSPAKVSSFSFFGTKRKYFYSKILQNYNCGESTVIFFLIVGKNFFISGTKNTFSKVKKGKLKSRKFQKTFIVHWQLICWAAIWSIVFHRMRRFLSELIAFYSTCGSSQQSFDWVSFARTHGENFEIEN